MEEGPAKIRRSPNPAPGKIVFQQPLTGAQTIILDTFFETTLGGGVSTWDDTHPRTGAAVVYRFVSRPRYEHIAADNFSASYEVEIVG